MEEKTYGGQAAGETVPGDRSHDPRVITVVREPYI
jgi:hypothetical protein